MNAPTVPATAATSAPVRRTARPAWLGPIAWGAGQAAGVLAILFVALGGSQRDFHVPFRYAEDALEYLMQTQGTIQQGWWWTHPHLGAPGAFRQVLYPSNTTVDQAVVWLVHLFTRHPALCLNVSWMLLVALSSLVATACLRLVGLSKPTAAAAGVLYALLPYALSRNIQHFSLVTYLVPIPCAAALLVASDTPIARRTLGWLAVGCALVGFDYTYYAFFAVFMVLVATTSAVLRTPATRAWRVGLMLIVVMLVATAINLAPSVRAWQGDDRPLVIPAKTAAESEIYGLKIRQLLSPVPDHPLALFDHWATLERRANFPIETENATSRLGLWGSIGFVLLLAVVVVPPTRRWWDDERRLAIVLAAASLTIALVLLATVGGFGSLFSLFVSPEIRAYNRVCPFIAFFAWVALGSWLDRAATAPAVWRAALTSAVIAVGVCDQVGALAPLNHDYSAIRSEWADVEAFAGALEPRVPKDAMVFQLPLTTYLNDAGRVRMQPYDEIKPYLVSHTIHWSYPALDNAVVRWQHAVARLPPRAMAASLVAAGFRAIAIDRGGYEDGGAALLGALGATGDPRAVLAESAGYVAVDLQHVDVSAGTVTIPIWNAAFLPASAGLPPCAFPMTAAIDHMGAVKVPPTGVVTLERSSTYLVHGWAIDDGHHALAGDVDVVVDGQPRAAFYGVNRPDVALRASEPGYRESGVLAAVPASALPAGAHRIGLRVVSADRTCASDVTTLGAIVPPMF